MRATQEARETLVVHCADGNELTSIVMADWILTDYVRVSAHSPRLPVPTAQKQSTHSVCMHRVDEMCARVSMHAL